MESLSHLEIRSSKFGKGLFAATDLAANTIICRVSGPLFTFQQTVELNKDESHFLQIERDLYLLCQPPFLYSNHSCDPNCALNAQLQLFTLREIKKDEELFWDYSTSMLERHWTMRCACGAATCRKVVTDFDLLPDDVQTYYLEKNMVLPFIIEHLQTFSKAHEHRA